MICPRCAEAADQLTAILAAGLFPEQSMDADTARAHAQPKHCGRGLESCSCQHRTDTAGQKGRARA